MAVRQSQARRSEIVRLAKTSGLASVDDLSTLFGVTPSTIRRDLGKLTSEGLLARTYGGAIALNAHPESSIRQRALEGFDAKRAIAKWAASQVLPGETVLLDAGTTVGAMGEFLRETERLTVITAGLTALEALADADDVRVECLGNFATPQPGLPRAAHRSCACPSNLRPRVSRRRRSDRRSRNMRGRAGTDPAQGTHDRACRRGVRPRARREARTATVSRLGATASPRHLGHRFQCDRRADPPFTDAGIEVVTV